MHDKFWAPDRRKLRDGALVLVNDATFETELDESRYRVLRVPATDLADELGNALGGSMVMAGAYAAIERARRARRAGRGDARVDPVVPHAAHRGERDGAPRRLRLGSTQHEHEQWSREESRARSRSTSRSARAASCASRPARRACSTMSSAVNHLGYHYPELPTAAPAARPAS